MDCYLKQRQYAKKCTCTYFIWTLVSELPSSVDRRSLWRPALLVFLAYQQVLTTVVLLPDPGWKQAEWFSLGHFSGVQYESPQWWPNGDPSMLRNNVFVMKWDLMSARFTQRTKFTTTCVTVERGPHWRGRILRWWRLQSPSGIDWLRKTTEGRNISKQVTVGPGHSDMSALRKVMSYVNGM